MHRRWLRYLLLLCLLFVCSLGSYSTWEVVRARASTAARVQAARDAGLYLEPSVLPPKRIAALLAVEDPSFWDHRGVDLSSPGAGLTTITQGLVKTMYFVDWRPGPKKLKQTLIARFALDPLVSKEEQLGLFLGGVYLGRQGELQVRGFAQGAQELFDLPLAELSDDQFLALVAMVIGPNGVHVLREPAANAERVSRIRRLLEGVCAPDGLTDTRLDGCAA